MRCTCPRCMIIGPGSQPIERRRGDMLEEIKRAAQQLEYWSDDIGDTMALARWRGDLKWLEVGHG